MFEFSNLWNFFVKKKIKIMKLPEIGVHFHIRKIQNWILTFEIKKRKYLERLHSIPRRIGQKKRVRSLVRVLISWHSSMS